MALLRLLRIVQSISEHLHHTFSTELNGVFLGQLQILFGHLLLLLSVLKPVLQLFHQGINRSSFEDVAFRQRKLLSSRTLGIGDDRDETAGEGLGAGHGLDLSIGSMDVQVRHVQIVAQLFLCAELHDHRVVQSLREPLVSLGVGSLAGQDENHVLVVLALGDSLDDEILTLLVVVSSDRNDDELVLELWQTLNLDGVEEWNSTVGEDVEVALVVIALEEVLDHLRGTVDIVHLVVDEPLCHIVDDPGEGLAPSHVNSVGGVLSKDMETRGDSDVHFTSYFDGGVGKRRGHQEVDDVGSGERLSDNGLVGLRERYSLVVGQLHDAIMGIVRGNDILSLFRSAWSDDSDGVAHGAEHFGEAAHGDDATGLHIVVIIADEHDSQLSVVLPAHCSLRTRGIMRVRNQKGMKKYIRNAKETNEVLY